MPRNNNRSNNNKPRMEESNPPVVDNKKLNPFSPTYGRATASNVSKRLVQGIGLAPDNLNLIKYSCNHLHVELDDALGKWKTFNKGTITSVIKKFSAMYYAETDPIGFDMDNMLDDVETVITKSAEAYAIICKMYQIQSGRQLKDEDNTYLGTLLFKTYDDLSLTEANWNDTSKTWAKIISPTDDKSKLVTLLDDKKSNAVWEQDILSNINSLYLNKAIQELNHYLFIPVHKMQYDDQTLRFINLWPNIGDLPINYDGWKAELDQSVKYVEDIIAKYPFLTGVMEHLGFSMGSDFNFSRDLAQQTVYFNYDTDRFLENIVYMCTGPYAATSRLVEIYSGANFVNTEGSVITYPDFVAFDISSLPNLLRGGMSQLTVNILTISKGKGSSQVYKNFYIMPYTGMAIVRSDGSYNPTATTIDDTISAFGIIQAYQAYLDPIASPYLNTFVLSGEHELNIDLSLTDFFMGITDGFINQEDAMLYRAQSSYNICFSESVSELIQKDIVVPYNKKKTNK